MASKPKITDRANAAVRGEQPQPSADATLMPWSAKPAGGMLRPGCTAAELVTREFPPSAFVVADMLGPGLTILAGRPKQGKSWLSLLIAWAVAGGYDLDGRIVQPGPVLYLALEDTERRLKGRLLSLQGGLSWQVPERLSIHTAWPRADQGGLYYIAEWLESQKDKLPQLVIVDTFGRFRKPQKGAGNSYADDYEAVGDLKQLLDHYKVAGVVVHHTRKLKAEDPFEELSGTQAISGAADSIWVLDRGRGDREAKLFITGRDLADATIPMTFDSESCRWTLAMAQDGIDTTGRDVAGEGSNSASNKVQQCAAWLKEFLAVHAYPSKDIETAAKVAGYSFSSLRDAKASLGKQGTGELVNCKFGEKEWWSGLGPRIGWKLRQAKSPETSETSDGSRDHWQDR